MQLDLLTPPASYSRGTSAGYQRHSDTSREGAEHANKTLSDRQRAVLGVIRRKGGATIHEVAIAMGIPGHPLPDNVVSGRVRELCKLGLVRDSGTKRMNVTGCTAVVWQEIRELTHEHVTDTLHHGRHT